VELLLFKILLAVGSLAILGLGADLAGVLALLAVVGVPVGGVLLLEEGEQSLLLPFPQRVGLAHIN
jgi:hypothetical protein